MSGNSKKASPPEDDKPSGKPSPGKPGEIVTGGWDEKVKIRRRTFPGPPGASEPLRVAMTRSAYAELTARAKESLNAEVCGVFVGELCEDDAGQFVSVEATIEGTGARGGSTHVTFTQETWTKIHEEKDKLHSKRQIVGWYHTHPGFGVEFSEMDLFVQRNFFSGPGQIAFVTDPLGGQEAILVNLGGEVVPISRFWVDGRERRCHNPAGAPDSSAAGFSAGPSVERAIQAMDQRIGQMMQMIDAQSASMNRFLLAVGMFVAVGICLFLGYSIYSSYSRDYQPPEVQSFVPVPVQIGDKSVLLGVGIVKWDVPPKLNAAMVQVERERQAKEMAEAAAATQPSSATKPSAK